MKYFIITAIALLLFSFTINAQPDTNKITHDSISAQPESVTATLNTTNSSGTEENTQSLYPMSEERKENLIKYSQFNNIWRFVDFFVGLGILLLILFAGFSAKMRNWANKVKIRFFAVWVFLILFVIVDYLLNLPFNIYRSFIVESDYGFMNQTFLQWWGEDLLNLFISMVILIIPVWFLYKLINKYKKNWWLIFSIGAIPFAVLMIVIAPVVISPLFNDYESVKDKQLETKLLTLATKAGIEGADVFQVNASKQSTKINAYVTGLFSSKRIVLYDNLIDNFTYDEILFVMGHEMGHYVMNHIWWGLLVAILFILFSLWLMNKTIHRIINRFKDKFKFDSLGDMASLPLIVIFISVLSFLFQPVTNGMSRYMEHQSDIYGMDITQVDGETAAIAFDKLSVFNLSDPDPNPIIEFWFYSHPALQKRMAFVRGYNNSGLN